MLLNIISTTPVIIGNYSKDGDEGRGISSITEYYLTSGQTTGITTGTTGWQTSFVSPTPSKKYLWNYSKINYSNGTNTKTIPVIIGNYAADGNDGRGISSITEYYLVYYTNTGVTTDTAGWSTSIPTMTPTSKYLWNYEEITFSDGMGYRTTPKVIGVYGDTGQDGQDGQDGENAEQWVLEPIYEKADVDSSGNLDLKFGYKVYHIEGNNVETVSLNTTSGYYIVIEADSSNVPEGVEMQHKLGNQWWTKDDYITDYYNQPNSKRPNGFWAYLVYQSNDNQVDGCAERYIRVQYGTMASLEVKNTVNSQGQTIASINATVAGHTTDISGLTNNLAQLQIQADSIQTQVTSTTNKIDNLNIGSTQLLRGINKIGTLTTNSNNATWANGMWLLTSGGNGTGEQFTLTDSPNKLCTVGWRILNNTNNGNRDFVQYKFPWVKDQQYTMSGYARATNGPGAQLLIRVWDMTRQTARVTFTKTLTSGGWQRFTYTFTLPSNTDISNSTFSFGLQGNCSAEFCCLKLEKGNVATDFSENPYDVDEEINTLTTNVTQVQQTASGLTTTVTALQTRVNQIQLKKKVIIDATSLSESTFYPVAIAFDTTKFPMEYLRCRVSRSLDNTYGVPSYASHQNGFVVDLDWQTKAGGWGTQTIPSVWSESDTVRYINDYTIDWVDSGEIVVGSIQQNYMKSVEIVYVRGGSKYDVETSQENATITLYPNGYSWSSGSYSWSSQNKTINQIVVPYKDMLNKSEIKQTAKEITQTVTGPLLSGDTNNLFFPACYTSYGMNNDDNNEFFVTSVLNGTDNCSSWYCDNFAKFGKPIKDSEFGVEITSSGQVYLYSPYVRLTGSTYYTLTFGGNSSNVSYLELCRYSSVSNALKINSNIAATTSIATLSNGSTFTYNSTRYSFSPSTTGYYRIRWRLTTEASATPTLNLNSISLYVGSISAGGFASWDYNISKSTSVVSQTADKIQMGVERAGINLSTGKITSIADNFEWQNNDGQTILGLNSNGDAEFQGTIKAKNFYHAICLAQWIQNNSSDPEWNVKYNVCGALYITNKSTFANDYNVHDLVPSSELATISTGDLIDLTDTTHYPTIISLYNQNYQMDGATPCIGYADEVIFMTPTSSNGTNYVILPPASSLVGKIVTVYNKAYSNTTISVKCAYSLDRLSPVAFFYNGEALVSGNTGQTISVSNNQWIKFLALSNGWLAMANGTSTFS